MSDFNLGAAAQRCADAVLSSHAEARREGIKLGLEAAAVFIEERLSEPLAQRIRSFCPDRIAERAYTAPARTAALSEVHYALWVAAEHNALHFGETHNTVSLARDAIDKLDDLR